MSDYEHATHTELAEGTITLDSAPSGVSSRLVVALPDIVERVGVYGSKAQGDHASKRTGVDSVPGAFRCPFWIGQVSRDGASAAAPQPVSEKSKGLLISSQDPEEARKALETVAGKIAKNANIIIVFSLEFSKDDLCALLDADFNSRILLVWRWVPDVQKADLLREVVVKLEEAGHQVTILVGGPEKVWHESAEATPEFWQHMDRLEAKQVTRQEERGAGEVPADERDGQESIGEEETGIFNRIAHEIDLIEETRLPDRQTPPVSLVTKRPDDAEFRVSVSREQRDLRVLVDGEEMAKIAVRRTGRQDEWSGHEFLITDDEGEVHERKRSLKLRAAVVNGKEETLFQGAAVEIQLIECGRHELTLRISALSRGE